MFLVYAIAMIQSRIFAYVVPHLGTISLRMEILAFLDFQFHANALRLPCPRVKALTPIEGAADSKQRFKLLDYTRLLFYCMYTFRILNWKIADDAL